MKALTFTFVMLFCVVAVADMDAQPPTINGIQIGMPFSEAMKVFDDGNIVICNYYQKEGIQKTVDGNQFVGLQRSNVSDIVVLLDLTTKLLYALDGNMIFGDTDEKLSSFVLVDALISTFFNTRDMHPQQFKNQFMKAYNITEMDEVKQQVTNPEYVVQKGMINQGIAVGPPTVPELIEETRWIYAANDWKIEIVVHGQDVVIFRYTKVQQGRFE